MRNSDSSYPRPGEDDVAIRRKADRLMIVFVVAVAAVLIGKFLVFLAAETYFPSGEIQEEQADDAMTLLLVGLVQVAVCWATLRLARLQGEAHHNPNGGLTAIRILSFVPVAGILAPLLGNLILSRAVGQGSSEQ